jgi:hypothetical protein
MANSAPTAKQLDPPRVGAPVEVWCSFDHAWHGGFRVHFVDRSDAQVCIFLARADGTLLPTPVDAGRIRSAD